MAEGIGEVQEVVDMCELAVGMSRYVCECNVFNWQHIA